MKIRYISLHIESEYDSGIDKKFSYKFNDNSRFISNYLSKAVRKLNIEVNDFKMLWIGLSAKNTNESVRLNTVDKFIEIYIPYNRFEQESYLKIMSWKERYEYYLSLIERGFRIANTYCDIQLDRLLEMTEQFRANNYKNEWLFAKKPLREHDMYLFFKCYFTHCDFRLELEAYNVKKTTLLTKGIVLQTLPSEICFNKKFKKIVICFNKIIILDFVDYPVFEIDLIPLSKGIFNVEEIVYDFQKEWEEQFRKDGITRPPKEEIIKFLDQL